MNPARNPTTSSDALRWPYQPIEGHYDELIGPNGRVRAPWQGVMGELDALGADELNARWDQARRFIHENGVTYNVYGDRTGMYRPWQLDAVPLMIGAEEWASVEQAIMQRATLLNAIIDDAYGERRLLHEAHLPPELLFGNAGFLRESHGMRPREGVWLNVYAADLARAPSGQWWVVNDRTQAPSGAGYALENRLVLSRTLPDAYERCQVHRLAGFFAALRDTLYAIAPARRDQPRVVLLTPGPYNETYFEHAYLARYLNFTLVEGSDLTVRDRRVFLKTLSGLLPVDVILRRQDDSYCDPLELRAESVLGVPGLTQAVRAGNVAVANALGTGVGDTPAMMAFLPGLCRVLLGEDLKMPSVATWWCGHRAARQSVIEQLPNLVVKPAFPADGNEVIFGNNLTDKKRRRLIERIEAEPFRYVAQERVALSTAPVWSGDGLQPRALMMRIFAVANPDGGYTVMPGGLTRVSGSMDSTLVSTQSGGGSKDTWVLSDTPVSHVTLLPAPKDRQRLTREGFVLPSRVADNLYWLGRYAERIESSVRTVRCLLGRVIDQSGLSDEATLPDLCLLLKALGRPIPELPADDEPLDAWALGRSLVPLVFEDTPGSVRADVQRLYRIAFGVRDRISLDAWRVLTRLNDRFVKPAGRNSINLNTATELLNEAVLILNALSGQAMEGMTREKGWRFMDIGRRIERAQNLVVMLRHALGRVDEMETERLAAVLEISNSLMTYRSRYLTSVEPGGVLDVLLLDESNPRSLTFQCAQIHDHVEHFAPSAHASRRTPETRLAMGLLASTRLAEVDELVTPTSADRRTGLVRMLDWVAGELSELSNALTHTYLSHAQTSRPLTDTGIGPEP